MKVHFHAFRRASILGQSNLVTAGRPRAILEGILMVRHGADVEGVDWRDSGVRYFAAPNVGKHAADDVLNLSG